MTFESLYIKSFGKLNEKRISFIDGINIIEGANESGKSTICAFIQFIFYGLPTRTIEKLRYLSWETSSASGSMIIVFNNVRYRIEREVKCTQNDEGQYVFREKCSICNHESNETNPDWKSKTPAEIFLSGVPSSVFESTAYIRQNAVSQFGTSSLGDQVENILFSGNERLNTNRALAKLEEARVALLPKNKDGGKIFTLKEQKEKIGSDLKNAQDCETNIIALEGSLNVLTENHAHMKKRLKEVQDELSEYEQYCIKKDTLFRESEKEKLRQTENQLYAAQHPTEHENVNIADPSYISMLERKQQELVLAVSRHVDAKKEFLESVNKIKQMGDKLSVFEEYCSQDATQRETLIQTMDDDQRKMDRCNLIALIFGLCSVFSIILTLLFRNNPALPDLVKYLSVTACLLFATAAAYFIFVKKHDHSTAIANVCNQFNCKGYEDFKELVKAAQENEAYMLALRKIREEKHQKMNRLADELDNLCSNIISILQDTNFRIFENAPVSLEKAIEKCREAQSQIQALEMRATEYRCNIENIKNKLAEYEDNYRKNACLAQYDEQAMEHFDLAAKKKEQSDLTEKAESFITRIHQIEVELASCRAFSTDPSAIAEKSAVIDHEIEELTCKWKAYRLAIETLNTASGKLREGISPKLAKRASKLFSSATEGKYSSIDLDANLALSFTDQNTIRNSLFLSAGTSDLAYICLRIALIELLYKENFPPFLFDESFSRMDDNRMEKALTLIDKYSQKYNCQIIIFTCHSREKSIMQTVGAHHVMTL